MRRERRVWIGGNRITLGLQPDSEPARIIWCKTRWTKDRDLAYSPQARGWTYAQDGRCLCCGRPVRDPRGVTTVA